MMEFSPSAMYMMVGYLIDCSFFQFSPADAMNILRVKVEGGGAHSMFVNVQFLIMGLLVVEWNASLYSS